MMEKKSKRNKNKKFTHIKNPLQDIISPLSHDDGVFKEICYIWSKIGDDINANSTPISLKREVLLVKVSSSPWVQQIQFMKSDIIDNINANFGTIIIKDIKFRLG